jgi:nitrogen fixation protein FixH
MATAGTVQTWKNFPRYMILAMLFVVAVNARFIYMAVVTFPGAASSDDFDTSNRYDTVMQAAAARDALGWSEQTSAMGSTAVLDITGPDHHALTGASITAEAVRPLGPDMETPLTFRETSAGHYVADLALPQRGQWDLQLKIAQGGHTIRVTKRVVIK